MKPAELFHATKARSGASGDGLDPVRRDKDNRQTAIFLVSFLAFCAAVAVLRFDFYIWTIETCCGIIYVAIFMFAFSVRAYAEDSSSLYSG